jgi:hypothetical protein
LGCCNAGNNGYSHAPFAAKASWPFAVKANWCGRSSAVERNLAKVEVVSSILIARSILFNDLADIPI